MAALPRSSEGALSLLSEDTGRPLRGKPEPRARFEEGGVRGVAEMMPGAGFASLGRWTPRESTPVYVSSPCGAHANHCYVSAARVPAVRADSRSCTAVRQGRFESKTIRGENDTCSDRSHHHVIRQVHVGILAWEFPLPVFFRCAPTRHDRTVVVGGQRVQYLLDITLRKIAESAGSLEQYCDRETSVHTMRIQSRIKKYGCALHLQQSSSPA